MLQTSASQCFLSMDALIPLYETIVNYTLQAFRSVTKMYSVNHITSSLHYPQSNGLAEKYLQIVKYLFNKAKEGGKDF